MGNYLSFRMSFLSEYHYERINFSEFQIDVKSIRGRLVYVSNLIRFYPSKAFIDGKWIDLDHRLHKSLIVDGKSSFEFSIDEIFDKMNNLMMSDEMREIKKNEMFQSYARKIYLDTGNYTLNSGLVYNSSNLVVGKIEITEDEFRRMTFLFKLF